MIFEQVEHALSQEDDRNGRLQIGENRTQDGHLAGPPTCRARAARSGAKRAAGAAVPTPKKAVKIVVCTRSSTWTLPQCVVTNLIVRWAVSIDRPNGSTRSLATGL